MSKDERYIKISKEIASWSKDPSTKVGVVIVGDKGQIVSQGYNGFPRGFKDTIERYSNRSTKYKYIIHAEANASVEGCTIYVHGLPPCLECAKAIVQSGIKRVVTDSKPDERWLKSNQDAMDIFNEAKVEFEYLEIKNAN